MLKMQPDYIAAIAVPRRFPDEITAVLRQRIDTGAYPPGSKLPPTRELAEVFRVSPPIVREALSRLKYDGYVEPRQGSGVYVKTKLSPASLRLPITLSEDIGMLAETFEMRLHVEQSCAELAAQRRTRKDLVLLRTELSAMAEAVLQRADGTAADVRFHFAVAATARNSAMLKLVEFVHGSLAASVKTARSNSDLTPGHPEAAQAEHVAIYQAIEAGDADAARLAVRLHMEGAAQRLGIRVGVPTQVGGPRKTGAAT